MSDFYDIYLEQVEKLRKDIKCFVKQKPSQRVLWLKSALIKEIKRTTKDPEVETFSCEIEDKSKFGFSEHFVNLLIEAAVNYGSREIDENSYQKGWEDCKEKILEKINED